MANKPVPQDHKPKQDKVKAKAVETKKELGNPKREVEGYDVTHRGFTVFVHKEAFDDFELLDDFSNLDQRKTQIFPRLLRRLIGDDYKIAMDGLRDATTGRVPIELGVTYVNEVLEAVNPNG